jgi:hypothetical protein
MKFTTLSGEIVLELNEDYCSSFSVHRSDGDSGQPLTSLEVVNEGQELGRFLAGGQGSRGTKLL